MPGRGAQPSRAWGALWLGIPYLYPTATRRPGAGDRAERALSAHRNPHRHGDEVLDDAFGKNIDEFEQVLMERAREIAHHPHTRTSGDSCARSMRSG